MFAPKRPLHRIAGGTEAARRHVAQNSKILTAKESSDPSIRAHNAAIEAERLAKKKAKAHGKP